MCRIGERATRTKNTIMQIFSKFTIIILTFHVKFIAWLELGDAMRCNNRIATFGESSARESSTWKIIIEFSDAKRSTGKREMECGQRHLLQAFRHQKPLAWWSSLSTAAARPNHHYFPYAFTPKLRCVNTMLAILKNPRITAEHCSRQQADVAMKWWVSFWLVHEDEQVRRENVESSLDLTKSSQILHTHGEYIIEPLPPFYESVVCEFHRAKNATLPTTNDSHFLSLCAPSSVPCFYIKFLSYMLCSSPTWCWTSALAPETRVDLKCVIYHSDKCFFIERVRVRGGRGTESRSTDERQTLHFQRLSRWIVYDNDQTANGKIGSWARRRERSFDAVKVRIVKVDGNNKSIEL